MEVVLFFGMYSYLPPMRLRVHYNIPSKFFQIQNIDKAYLFISFIDIYSWFIAFRPERTFKRILFHQNEVEKLKWA